MNGHIEYVNGFPVWVDGETNQKTSFTSTSTGIAEDLEYYPSTTTTPIGDSNMKDKNEHNMSAADAAAVINLLISDCNPKWVNNCSAQAALVTARKSLHRNIPVAVNRQLQKNTCPSCGLPVSRHEDVNYCGTCGQRLDWGSYFE